MVMEPTLLNIFNSDLSRTVRSMLMKTVDSKKLGDITNSEEIIMQEDLFSPIEWSMRNGIKINSMKCKVGT